MDSGIEAYAKQIPVSAEVAAGEEVFWVNSREYPESRQGEKAVSKEQIQDMARRLERFVPYLAKIFLEMATRNDIIESELQETRAMRQELDQEWGTGITRKLFLKVDSHLPIPGLVKAREGICEVLRHAEDLTSETGLLNENEGYRKLNTSEVREFFGRCEIQVGSTGNLGLNIGIMSAKLGFQVTVHISADAKQWKKDLLKSRGATIIEYKSDYCAAMEEGKKSSDQDPMSYFAGGENSANLFPGYAVAGQRLKHQLEEQGTQMDRQHPLFVYLPRGTGRAPDGVVYGLKEIYDDCVHCFFMEPTQARYMLIGVATGEHDKICVGDLGINGRTDTGGLAVRRPSAFVGKVIEKRLAGICTIEDGELYELMRALMEAEDISIESSAYASSTAFLRVDGIDNYIREKSLDGCMGQAVHIAWATGGNMIPPEVVAEYLNIRAQSASL